MKALTILTAVLGCMPAFAAETVTLDFGRFEFAAATVAVPKKSTSPLITRTLVVSGGEILEDRSEAAILASPTKLAQETLNARDYCELTTSYLGSGPLPKGEYALPRAIYPIRVDVSAAMIVVEAGKDGALSTAWAMSPLYAVGETGRFVSVPTTFGTISGSFGMSALQCKTHFDPAKNSAPTLARMIENGFGNTAAVESAR